MGLHVPEVEQQRRQLLHLPLTMPVLTLLARSGWLGWYRCWEIDWLQPPPSPWCAPSLPPHAGYICTAVIMRRAWSLDYCQLIGALHVFEAWTLPSRMKELGPH